ncbi:MAG: polyphosphate polymerase domain-containing protein [Prolixibacteraceae bacterium]|nr:polyphosphate polymerase domain-containing protein [Prolixibacteraceae bacterium]
MHTKNETYINSEFDFFKPISLSEMDKVRLMNRTDTKFWFHASHLYPLLELVQDSYYILQMHDEVALPYSTVYYDTDSNGMYTAHHNGKLNRYKIRRRSYVSSGISFLEVKFKNNKGRTIKKRIPADFDFKHFNDEENKFIQGIAPFTVEDLSPSLINDFKRITLVNRNFKERCTIDFNLGFKNENKEIKLNNLVIVEIKADGSPSASPLARALRDQRIKKSGFSKYCVGRTVLDTNVKRNAFKQKVRMIEKVINTEECLYN